LNILLFIPSYNDTLSAYLLSKKFIRNEQISKILLIDESDHPDSISLLKKIKKNKKIEVIHRKRKGKWSAWRLAFIRAKEYDGIIELDADIKIKYPYRIISGLEKNEVITAYQDIDIPRKLPWKIISRIYQDMHNELMKRNKFNMGGQIIALKKDVVLTLLKRGFFKEPVKADDHVIALAAYILGFKCKSIDCGLTIGLPTNINDWIKYRSRHKGAIRWAEDYVALKTGKEKLTNLISKLDINLTKKYFIKNVLKKTHVFAPLFLLFFIFSSMLSTENPVKWSRIQSEKI
jgi:hypothetical protein